MAPQKQIPYNGMLISERDRAFLERSDARIEKIDKASLNKAAKYEPTPGVRNHQDMMAQRWRMYALCSR
jgi:hypothetical protein